MKVGTAQRILAGPVGKDDTHKSGGEDQDTSKREREREKERERERKRDREIKNDIRERYIYRYR